MALSKCPSCDHRMFEMVENEPYKSNFKYMFIQCSKCGSVVGLTEYFNVGKLVKDQQNSIDSLKKQVSYLTSLVESVHSRLK